MSRVSKTMYKSTSLACSLLGSMVATKIFDRIWSAASRDETPPSPAMLDQRMRYVLSTALLHGAIVGVTRAVFERAGARGFRRVTGDEPGE